MRLRRWRGELIVWTLICLIKGLSQEGGQREKVKGQNQKAGLRVEGTELRVGRKRLNLKILEHEDAPRQASGQPKALRHEANPLAAE